MRFSIAMTVVVLLIIASGASALGAEKYSFGYKTEPGEVLYYVGEVKTDVQVPWHESQESGISTLYYRSTLLTQESDKDYPVRVEDTEVALPNGEQIQDRVTYQVLAPDFVYVQEMGSAVTAGLDFFPPVPVAPGATWTIKSDLLVPLLNDTIAVTTKYHLVDVVSIEGDQVAVISQDLAQESYQATYLKSKVEIGFQAKGFVLWSLISGDYVGRFVDSQITMEVPEILGEGTMTTSIERSELIDGGDSLPAAPEAYISLFVDYLTIQ